MIDGWISDTPPKGRNQWGYSQAIRLECAYRSGCVTEDDYRRGREVLTARFTHIVRTTEPVREPGKYEFADWWRHARRVVAAKTDEQVRAELGGHEHEDWFDRVGKCSIDRQRQRTPRINPLQPDT